MPQRVLSEPEFNAIRDRVLQSAPDGLDESGFNRWVGPAMAQALGEAESTPAAPEGSVGSRFLSNAGEMLNPVNIAKGVYNTARHPIDTATAVGQLHLDQGRKAWELAKAANSFEDYLELVGRVGATALPVLGPVAAEAGEQIGSGDVAGGIGKAVGVLAPMAVPTAIRGVKRVAQTVPDSVAARAESGAASRVVDVMAPKVGPNKTRFGNMAEDVAPAVAKDIAKEPRMWTREALHGHVQTRLGEAEAALDAASDARLAARTFNTKPLIDALMEKRRALTSEAVEASHRLRAATGPAVRWARPGTEFATTGDIAISDVPAGARGFRTSTTGEFVEPQLSSVKIGTDVVPSPNAGRIAVIDQAITELKRLGPVARYEPIRVMRQAYDGPAKAVYSPSMTADYMKAQGGKLGAADVTGVLRENLAKWDPPTAEANSQYSLWRKADDVLQATVEVERTRPRVGRQIIGRLTGTVLGAQTAGAPGAVAGYVFGPVVDTAAAAGATTRLATARMLGRLAAAIRSGNVKEVTRLSSPWKRIGTPAAAQTGRITNQTGPSMQSAPAAP